MNILREKQRLLPLCGLMISSPSSSSKTDQTTNNTTNATDKRVVADGGSTVIGDNSTVTMTDLNSVQKAADLAQTAVIEATKTATTATTGSTTIASKAIDLTGAAFTELSNAYKDANTNAQAVASGNKTLVIGGGILLAVLALSSLGKKRA